MAISTETREQVRQRFGYRCGYCGVHEYDVGSELEIDYFQPLAQGGTDDLENLVYCCSACNNFKHDYWPARDAATNPRRLLHPLQDKLEEHLVEDENG
jgi:5-methylcytosine-specific restriction endonuclease McrA